MRRFCLFILIFANAFIVSARRRSESVDRNRKTEKAEILRLEADEEERKFEEREKRYDVEGETVTREAVFENDADDSDFGDDTYNKSVDSLLTYAFRYMGKPYRGGATGPFAFDCSGFTSFVYAHFGYKLTHNSAAQTNYGKKVSKARIKPGDLVFFNGRSARSGRIGHVGIATRHNEDGSFNFIHASCSNGVIESSSSERYYAVRYVTARRLIGVRNRDYFALSSVDDEGKSLKSALPGKTGVGDGESSAKLIPSKYYRVRRGDNLGSIAGKFGCTVGQLKRWNNLRSSRINAGQRLVVNMKKSETDTAKTNERAVKTAEETEPEVSKATTEETKSDMGHVVEKGETLYSLSRRYGIPVSEIQSLNSMSSTTIKVGDVIKLK